MLRKQKKVNQMTYGEIKAEYVFCPKCYDNGKSAAKPRIEEGSTTIIVEASASKWELPKSF